MGNSDQVPDTATLITKQSASSIFNLNNFNETVAALNMTSGIIQTGTGTLTVGGDVTSSFNATPGSITGKLALPAGIHNVTVNNSGGGTTGTLSVAAAISGAGTINKLGPGTLLLTGANNFGGFTLGGGVIGVSSAASLGASSVTINGGTLRATGALTGTQTIGVGATGGGFDSNGFASALGSISATGSFTKTGAGTLAVNSLNTAALTVSGGTLRVQARSVTGGNSVARINGALAVTGSGALDLNDNDLVVAGSAFSTVQQMVYDGFRSSPDPSATGLTSTTAQNDGGREILALFDNAMVGVANWPPDSSHTVSGSAIIGKYTYFGDTNVDGQVTGDDYAVIDANINTTPAPGIASLSGDANLDGLVTGDDYAVIDASLSLGSGQPLAQAAMLASIGALRPMSLDGVRVAGGIDAAYGSAGAAGYVAVPEPGSAMIVIAAGAGVLLGRRRRSRR